MSEVFDTKIDIHFGEPGSSLPDWRKGRDESDPDDELLRPTPLDVVAMLGFDPLELEK